MGAEQLKPVESETQQLHFLLAVALLQVLLTEHSGSRWAAEAAAAVFLTCLLLDSLTLLAPASSSNTSVHFQ